MDSTNIIEVLDIPDEPTNNSVYIIKTTDVSGFTHGFFKYPCKFIPNIPRWFIKKYASSDTKKYGILDPFMGSGTTLVEASLLWYKSYGIDIDPLSKLLSKVKTTPLNEVDTDLLNQFIADYPNHIERFDANLKILKDFTPSLELIQYWFTEEDISKLAYIRYLIYQLYEKSSNDKVRDFLYVILSSIIRKVSKADNQSPKPYISTRIKKEPINVFDEFKKVLFKNFIGIKEFSQHSKGDSKIIWFDARNIDINNVDWKKISLAMTSPPYINAFDYVRSLKLENFWLDGFKQEKNSELYDFQVWTEKVKSSKDLPIFWLDELDIVMAKIHSIDKKRAWITYEYFMAMKKNIESVFKCLKIGWYYCIVVGNSTIRNTQVDTAKFLTEIALRAGFTKELSFSYIIRNRYLRIPRANKGWIIPMDHILIFKK